ncbi:MAG TPA: RES family NAD+ phosphorylase [Bryobacteraceae bacterium]
MRSTETGRCSYCDSEGVSIVSPSQLGEYFELLINAYEPNRDGKPLVKWFREDWGLFEHQRMGDTLARDLLVDILEDGEIVHQPFIPAPDLSGDRLAQWEQLRGELMYRNRFFPGVNIDLDRLQFLLSQLTIDGNEIPNVWHRARIQTSDMPFLIGDMGAPPKRVASHGRANPAGIPYLYLGSTPETAVCEIRPHTGETACVADFRTPDGLTLVDLRRPKKMVSPFLLEDAQSITRMRSDLPFLERLGDELTRPVVPQSAAIDYTPSQYVCEFIKKCGYHGVVYRSSVSNGINLALFDPTSAQPGAVTRYRVARVSVDVTTEGV